MKNTSFFVALSALVILFQVPTFFAPHNEGDEVAYLGLSHEMNWDLSNYTVRDVEPVNNFPNKLYRAEIFIHPPLFPLLLKLGWTLGAPVGMGLVFNGVAKLALMFLVYMICKCLALNEQACRLSAVFITFCPIIGFVSTRLLIDILFTTAITGALYFLIAAISLGSLRRLLWATICFSIALNAKFQGIIFLPLFAIAWIYSARATRARLPDQETNTAAVLFLSLATLIVIGLSHHIRLYCTYGLTGIVDLVFTVERPVGMFVQRMSKRSLGKMLLYLLIMQPWVLALMVPTSVRTLFQAVRSKPEIRLLLGFALYGIAVISCSAFQQERYWAPVFPILFILASVVTTKADQPRSSEERALSGLTLASLCLLFVNNVMTNVMTAGATTAIVRPVLLRVLPFLEAPGGPFAGF